MAGKARSTEARRQFASRTAGLAVLALALLAPPAVRAGIGAVGGEDIVIELLAGRLARQTLLARTAGGLVLVPARPLFEMIEVLGLEATRRRVLALAARIESEAAPS